jgi:hypothetical protein
MSYIWLYVSLNVSFNYMFCLWFHTCGICVFNIWLFFSICKIFIVFSIVSYLCPVSITCCAHLEHCPLFFMSLIYYVLNVCHIYLCGHSVHCSWYTPLKLYLSMVFLFVLNSFYITICSKWYSHISIFKQFGDRSSFWSKVCEGDPFSFLFNQRF